MIDTPAKTRLLLIGGGIQHAQLLKFWSLNAPNNPGNTVDIALIAEEAVVPYLPMFADLMAGHCNSRDCSIDLRHLCTSAGARYIEGRVVKFSAATRQVSLQNGQQYHGDLISLDASELGENSEDAPFGQFNLSPRTSFYRQWQHFKSHPALTHRCDLAIIGDSEHAVETALALRQHSTAQTRFTIHLLYADAHLLPQQNFTMQQKARDELDAAGITLHPGFKLRSIDKRHEGVCVIAPDRALSARAAIICDRPQTPLWLEHCGLALNQHGELTRNEYGQAESYAGIFICPTNDPTFDKQLAKNIERQAHSVPLKKLTKSKHTQNTIKNGQGYTLAHSIFGAFKSHYLWRWQQFRQRRIVRWLNR